MFTPQSRELGRPDPAALGKCSAELPTQRDLRTRREGSIELTTQMLATLLDFPFEEAAQADALVRPFTALPKAPCVVEAAEQSWKEMEELPGLFPPISGTRSASTPSRAMICVD